jgi:hypothetical protein
METHMMIDSQGLRVKVWLSVRITAMPTVVAAALLGMCRSDVSGDLRRVDS